MKNKKIFGKKQFVMAALLLVLGAAVWLNMEYASGAGGFISTTGNSSVKNLGDTKYVMNESVVAESDDNSEDDSYFETARKNRKKAREDALALLEEAANKANADADAKAKVVQSLADIADRMEKESATEELIKAKGFEDTVVIIGDKDVNVIVKSDSLLPSQILQIQDAVCSGIEISLENIKIVNRK